MAFTLTDPRAQSQYRQGLGIGSGIGDQVVRNFESQRLQEALGNITPNMPMNEVLKQLAMSRVSPENVNTYLSPVVQQRLGQQNAAQQLSEATRLYQSGQIDLPAYFSQIMQAQAMSGQNIDTQALLDMVRGMNYGNQGANQNQQVGNVGSVGSFSPLASTPENPSAYRSRGELGRETRQIEPTIEPYTQQERQNIRRDYVARYGNALGMQYANNEIADRDAAYNQEIAKINAQTSASKQELEAQKDLREFFDVKLQERGITENWLGDLIKQQGYNQTGSNEKRWNAVDKKYIQPYLNSLDQVENQIKVPFTTMNSEEKKKAFKNFQNEYEKTVSKFPKEYKKDITEKFRTVLRNRNGMGLVSTELALKEPNKKTLAQISKIGEAPQPNLGILPPKIREKQNQSLEKNYNEASEKLSEILYDIAGTDESLLPLKHAVVRELGYPDEVWDKALNLAQEKMAKDKKPKTWSDFQDQTVRDSRLLMRPSLVDMIRGTSSIPLSGVSQ